MLNETESFTKESGARVHNAALDWVHQSFHNWRQYIGDRNDFDVLEIGSLNINGSPRGIIEPFSRSYYGIDMQDGPGVDKVMNAAEFIMPESFDVIVCCEVFEHTPQWKQIIDNCHTNLREGGIFIATMAGETRKPHSGVHGNAPYEWEHYANIGEWELAQKLRQLFEYHETSYVNPMVHGDLRCWAVKD